MECQEARRLLHELLDGDIERANRERLHQHLASCRDCQRAERSLKQTADLLKEMGTVQAPADFTDQLMRRLPKVNFPFLRTFAVAAVLLLLLASPLYLASTLSRPQLICRDRQVLIVQEKGQFVVPANQVVHGNITVYRSNLLVQGSVRGDVFMVDGRLSLQGEGNVSGQVSEQPSTGRVQLKLAFAELWEDLANWFFSR